MPLPTTHTPKHRQPPTQYVDAGLATEAEAAALVAQVRGLKLQELNAIFRGLGLHNKEKEAPAAAAADAEAPAFAPLKDVASVAGTPAEQLKEWEALGALRGRVGCFHWCGCWMGSVRGRLTDWLTV